MKKINFEKVKSNNQRKEKKKTNKKTNSNIKNNIKPTNHNKTETKKIKKKKFRIWYWLMIFIVLIALALFIGGIGFCYYIVTSAPEFNIDKMFEKEASRLFTANGELFATLGTEQRQKVNYNEIPQVLVDAIIATEDSRFFQHNGFDAPRFLKASISQLLGKGGGGASTLTMQLSKLSFTSTESSGIEGIIRKFTDIYMSVFKIEKNLTKEEIFEYYINTPCMSGNIYGVQQASKYLFGKDVKDINLVEAAQIAGMFQSPNGYNPYVNPNDANKRKNTVLYLMKRHEYITDLEYKAATKIEIKDLLVGGKTSTNEYQGFIDTVVQEVIDKTGNNPYDIPMDIYTTMVKSKQDIINNFYKTYKFKDKKVEVGVGAIDNKTGGIIAVGAGRYKTSAMTLNVATFHGQTKRAPGSTAKPIVDYGPAIEYTNLSTYGPFIDEKTSYAGSYMKDFGKYKGFMSMKDCLKNSINTCALQAFRLTTNNQKVKFANDLGIIFYDNNGNELKQIPESYSIGTFNGVSPIQLAGAYAAFGSGGYYSEPHSFTKLIYRETEEVYEQNIERKKVMKPQTAYIISSILINATSGRVRVPGTQVATKTGTTSYDQEYLKKFGLSSNVIPDAWTSSYTKDYAVAIWYGYIDGLNSETVKNKYYLKNSETGNERTKIQAAIVNKLYETNSKFKNPGGLTTVEVEMETIPPQLPSEYTPSNLRNKFIFITGTEPKEISTRFSKLSDPTNISYKLENNNINLSWESPGTPSAIDKTYLTNYFNNGYGEWSEQYLQKRIDYNNSYIGNIGYEIYLSQGTDSTYIGYTTETSYTIDASQFLGSYDGVIIKSSYSKFKNNASNGAKVLFEYTPDFEDKINENLIIVKMNGLSLIMHQNDEFTELNQAAIDSIKYNGIDIKDDVKNLSVITTKINKITSQDNIPPTDITKNKGTYKVYYTVSFIYKNTSINKNIVQMINVI